ALHASARQRPGDGEAAGGERHDLFALEGDLRVVGDVEEVGRAQVLVALRGIGIDALGVDGELDGAGLRVLRVHLHGALEGVELAAYLGDEVADLEADGRVLLVDRPGVGGGRGGQ